MEQQPIFIYNQYDKISTKDHCGQNLSNLHAMAYWLSDVPLEYHHKRQLYSTEHSLRAEHPANISSVSCCCVPHPRQYPSGLLHMGLLSSEQGRK